MAEDLNLFAAEGRPRDQTAGNVPEPIRRRYLTEARGGPGLGFYVDARTETAAFRDQGRRLTTGRNDPHVVRDLVAIARHRGWGAISVRGDTEFRREVYHKARAAGLEVRGYRPTPRDRQHADRRARGRPGGPTAGGLDTTARMRIVETVVRDRVVEPGEQSRILSAARARLPRWLGPELDRRPHEPARSR